MADFPANFPPTLAYKAGELVMSRHDTSGFVYALTAFAAECCRLQRDADIAAQAVPFHGTQTLRSATLVVEAPK